MLFKRNYNPKDVASIFAYSRELLHRSLAEVMPAIDASVTIDEIEQDGKGGVGVLVEKYFFGYKPNSDPRPDFPEAGLELKVTPLKKLKNDELAIKERLVCDMIDYMEIVDEEFENSRFCTKSMLMLILFYLHINGCSKKDLTFLYSVLWQIKGKDLLIIKQDFITIRDKVRRGLAHELSEGDTLYLGACRKGQKGDFLRTQPFSDIEAPRRAFSLKPAYMRTILDFVRDSGSDMATNTEMQVQKMQLVSEQELRCGTFEDILTGRLMTFKGCDYRQIAEQFGMTVKATEKSKLARVTKRILLEGLNDFNDAEEIRKAGIIVKTIRVEQNGAIRENMSFENIDYDEVWANDEWLDSRWYEIVTSRFMFVVFRESPNADWGAEKRYVLDNMIFWTMPAHDLQMAEDYWENIRQNVVNDTLSDTNNTFWREADKKLFHVRPKAQTSRQKYTSPLSGIEVPKKCYWFNRKYVKQIINEECQ